MRSRALFPALGGAVALLALFLVVRSALAAPTPTDRIATAAGDASGGIAVIPSSSGYRLVVRGLVLHSTSAGVATFKDGSDEGAALGRVYLEADVPLTIPQSALGGGIETGRGRALFVRQAGTVSTTLRYNEN